MAYLLLVRCTINSHYTRIFASVYATHSEAVAMASRFGTPDLREPPPDGTMRDTPPCPTTRSRSNACLSWRFYGVMAFHVPKHSPPTRAPVRGFTTVLSNMLMKATSPSMCHVALETKAMRETTTLLI
jgi:hypothetical protein